MESIKAVYSKGEKSAAITELKHLVQEVPLYLQAYSLLAEYQLADGDRASAIDTLKIAVDKAAPPLKSGFKRKIQMIGKLFKAHENYSEFQHAIKLINQGNLEDARNKLETISKLEVDHEEVLLRLGQVSLLLAEPKKAVIYLEKVTRLDPKLLESRSWLGRSYFLLGEVKKSELAFRKINWASAEVTEQSILWWSEVLFASRGRRVAIEFLENQLESHPRWVQVLVKCAEYRSGLFSKNSEAQRQAKKELQLALSRFDDYASKAIGVGLETPFGINQLNLETLKKEIQESMSKLDEKLKKLDEAHP